MKNFEQHKGKQLADRIKFEDEYEKEVQDFDLMEWLFKSKQETK